MASRAEKAAQTKQYMYDEADRQRKNARRLDSLGFSDKADTVRRDAEECAQIAQRMETCPRVPR